MKNLIICAIFSFFIASEVLARSTGCKEGNCENGYGLWVYTDKTTYEGYWVGTKKNMAKEQKPGLMDIYIKVNSRIVFGAAKALYTFQMVQRMKENGPMDS